MQVMATDLPGVYVIEPTVHGDARGFFLESFNAEALARHGLSFPFVQDNHAKSGAHVLRGLHYQKPPMAQTKLVRVTAGRVLDVVLDIRKGSPTFGQWRSFELSAANFRQLLAPQGFAHGYVTLEPDTEFLYKVDNYYSPEHDAGVLWNDPDLGIDWGATFGPDGPALSAKDRQQPRLRDIDSPFVYIP